MEPAFVVNFSPEVIGGIVAAIISIVFSRFPVVRTWYARKTTDVKSAIMLLALLILLALICLAGLSNLVQYIGLNGQPIVWDPFPWPTVFSVTLIILATNQSLFMITPEAEDVKEIKAAKSTALVVENLRTFSGGGQE